MLSFKIKLTTAINTVKGFFLIGGALLSSCVFASTLTDISYNTIQNDEIKLTFTFSENIIEQPQIKTSVEPALITMVFNADSFNQNLGYTDVSHAGVEGVSVKRQGDKVLATVSLDTFSVFDISQVENTFSIQFNKDTVPVTSSNKKQPTTSSFLNKIEAIDFNKIKENTAQLVVDLTDSVVAVNVKEHLGKLHVEFYNTDISEDLLYKIDVTDFGTIVQEIETFQENKNSLFVIETSDEFDFEHRQENDRFILSLSLIHI